MTKQGLSSTKINNNSRCYLSTEQNVRTGRDTVTSSSTPVSTPHKSSPVTSFRREHFMSVHVIVLSRLRVFNERTGKLGLFLITNKPNL